MWRRTTWQHSTLFLENSAFSFFGVNGPPKWLCNHLSFNVNNTSMPHHHIHNSPPSVPILSQINPFHVPSDFPKVNFNIILSSTPESSKWSLSLRFVYQNHVCTSRLPHTCYVSLPSHSSLKSVIHSWTSDVLREASNREPISHNFKLEKLYGFTSTQNPSSVSKNTTKT